MPAPKGNQYAKGHKGTKGRFTPQQWADAIQDYFDYCDKNPIIYKNKALKSGDRAGEIIRIPTARRYSIRGLCDYANVSLQRFYTYLEKEGEEYFEITSRARNRIFQENKEG